MRMQPCKWWPFHYSRSIGLYLRHVDLGARMQFKLIRDGIEVLFILFDGRTLEVSHVRWVWTWSIERCLYRRFVRELKCFSIDFVLIRF